MIYFGGFFVKLGHFAGFSLYIINITPYGSKKGRIRRRRIAPTRRIRRDKKRRIRREESEKERRKRRE